MKKRILTGITTTGTPLVGNYIGAIRPALKLINKDDEWKIDCQAKYGTKMTVLIEYLNKIFKEEKSNNRAIIFSQYDNMLKLIGKTLKEYNIKNGIKPWEK